VRKSTTPRAWDFGSRSSVTPREEEAPPKQPDGLDEAALKYIDQLTEFYKSQLVDKV
tara:strand:+ start:93 stop:263 length:171 start_codon:yes stop_codon:yes gene_type:complete